MIKLFDGDDDQEKTPEVKPAAPSSLSIAPEADPVPVEPPGAEDTPAASPAPAEESVPEVSAPPDVPAEPPPTAAETQEEPSALRREELPAPDEEIPPPHEYGPVTEDTRTETGREYPPGFSENGPKQDVYVAVPYKPQTKGEAIRGAGLAWSAGIIFFGSIVFMLILGWGADLLLGSSPWGIVGGIVLGSLIGFIQFFRISAQIFKK